MSSKAREPLRRERIAATALALTDQEGLDALSMRKLGAALDVEAMSLYNHVANKDDLFAAMGEHLYRDVLARYGASKAGTPAQRPWRDDAYELFSTFRAVALEHPNALSLMLDRPIPGQTRLEFMRTCYELLRSAGFPTKEAALAFDTAASWLVGSVRLAVGLMAEITDGGVTVDRANLPEEFQGTYDFMAACIAWTPDQRFEHGFATSIDGLEHRLATIRIKPEQ